MRWKILIPAVTLGLAALLTGLGWDKKARVSDGFQEVLVTREDIQASVLETGNVQPHNQLAVFPPLSGRIEKILSREGDTVRKGQKLMELSSTERATLLDEAAAQGISQLGRWEQYYQATPLLSPENGRIIYLPTVPGQVVNTGVTIMNASPNGTC